MLCLREDQTLTLRLLISKPTAMDIESVFAANTDLNSLTLPQTLPKFVSGARLQLKESETMSHTELSGNPFLFLQIIRAVGKQAHLNNERREKPG